MTRILPRRCAHCSVVYSYQSSGDGAPRFNDGRYCPDCARTVAVALANVPARVERVQREVTDPELVAKVLEAKRAHAAKVAEPPKDWEAELELKAHHFAQMYFANTHTGELADVIAECAQQWRAEAPAKNDLSGFFGRLVEIRPGLFSADGRAAEHHTVVRTTDGVFTVIEWTDNRKPVRVTQDMERDLASGAERPWRDYERA